MCLGLGKEKGEDLKNQVFIDCKQPSKCVSSDSFEQVRNPSNQVASKSCTRTPLPGCIKRENGITASQREGNCLAGARYAKCVAEPHRNDGTRMSNSVCCMAPKS